MHGDESMRAPRTGANHWVRSLRLAALVVGASVSAFASAKNVALLIAVGQFADPQLQTQQLLGTATDIDSMQQALTTRWGFDPKDLVALRDQQATRDRILAEISALEQRSAPGDTVLLYFSGHGTSANADNNSFDLPYATGAWVPYDLDFSSVAAAKRTLIIGRRDLVPRLKALDAGGRRVVVVSDSCYSGQVVRAFGQTHSVSRYLHLPMRDLGIAPVAAAVGSRPAPPPYPYQHVILLSGASDSETGADISSTQALATAPTLDGKYHGAFTDAFLRLLDGQLVSGTFNYAQGRDALNAFLEHRHFAQHPQLLPGIAEDPENVGSAPFLGMGMPVAMQPAPAAPPATTVVRVRVEGVSDALRQQIAALAGVAVVAQDADLVLSQDGAKAVLRGPAGDPIATTVAGDPTLIERIAAQAWLARSLPRTDQDRLGLRAETDPASRGNTYVACESFVFELRLEKPAYVMLLDLDSQGRLTVLYPTRAAERQSVAPGVAHAIPGSDPKQHIVVTAPFGTDVVTVLAFAEPPAFFTDLTGVEPFRISSARAAALATGLAGARGAVSVRQVAVNTYPGASSGSCGT
jgi:hypothetical protein